MNVRVKYRIFVCFLLVCSILGLGYCSWEMLREMIPEQVQVSEEGEIPDLFSDTLDSFVTTEMTETLEVSSLGTGRLSSDLPDHSEEAVGVKGCSYEISCSLFGKIPLKTVSVSVVPRQKLYAGGIPIGIYMETDGVLVVDTGNIVCGDGKTCCPAENIVKSGDYIQSVDGETVGTKEELIECISSCSGSEVVLTVERNGETISLKLQPVLDQSGCYKAGIWVRNDTQGIGTLTYIREDGTFGALGHGISDIDTGDLLEISDGTLYEADVVSVVKGEQGTDRKSVV